VDYQSHVDQVGYSDWWKANFLNQESGYSTDLITRHANDFIARHKSEPFFLYIPHEAPHYPYQDRESKADRFPGRKLGVDFPEHGSEKDPVSVYKNMIEIMDEDIGSVLNTLKKHGIYENTVVIFCSDNGATKIGSNGILRGYKGSVWEGGHRVPAIIQWPGHIRAGVSSGKTVLSMDFFPTILKLAGIDYTQSLDGISIADLLLHEKSLESRIVFWQHGKGYAARDGKWKLIVHGSGTTPELYNLEDDMEEKNDVAGDHPEIVEKLLSALEKWKKDVSEGVKKVSS